MHRTETSLFFNCGRGQNREDLVSTLVNRWDDTLVFHGILGLCERTL